MSADENGFAEEVWTPDPEGEWVRQHRYDGAGISLADFYAFAEMNAYFFAPTRALWPAVAVDSRLPPVPLRDKDGNPVLDNQGKPKMMSPSKWLARHRSVEQVTWCPGLPMLVRDRLVSDGGWIPRDGVATFNLYRGPTLEPGDPTKAGRWLDHVSKIYPSDAVHIVLWLAHRVQRPEEKINHALVLGGAQGIGKDTLLEPVKRAVGAWNFHDVSPPHLLGTFNGFAKSVILRVNEGRDLGDINRFTFYDHTKIYTAAPPDVLRVNEKHIREYAAFNVLGFLVTTNHKQDGIYLPADDRRHYVAWATLTKEAFSADYWAELWGWYESGGFQHVAAHLAALDLSNFDPKAPPPKTAAFYDIVDASRAPEEAELRDVIDELGNPDVLTLDQLIKKATGEAQEWLSDRKNRRAMPFRLERAGYLQVRNPDAEDGYWRVKKKRQPVYGKAALPVADLIKAARKL
jgi:hypothetical protein